MAKRKIKILVIEDDPITSRLRSRCGTRQGVDKIIIYKYAQAKS